MIGGSPKVRSAASSSRVPLPFQKPVLAAVGDASARKYPVDSQVNSPFLCCSYILQLCGCVPETLIDTPMPIPPSRMAVGLVSENNTKERRFRQVPHLFKGALGRVSRSTKYLMVVRSSSPVTVPGTRLVHACSTRRMGRSLPVFGLS